MSMGLHGKYPNALNKVTQRSSFRVTRRNERCCVTLVYVSKRRRLNMSRTYDAMRPNNEGFQFCNGIMLAGSIK